MSNSSGWGNKKNTAGPDPYPGVGDPPAETLPRFTVVNVSPREQEGSFTLGESATPSAASDRNDFIASS